MAPIARQLIKRNQLIAQQNHLISQQNSLIDMQNYVNSGKLTDAEWTNTLKRKSLLEKRG